MKLHICKGKSRKPRSGNKTTGERRKDSPAYWEARLKKCGLPLDRGWNPDWLSYGHDFGRGGLDYDGVTVYGMNKKQRGERIVQSGEENTAGKASGRREP